VVGTPFPSLAGFLGFSDADDLLTSGPYALRGNPVNARLLRSIERISVVGLPSNGTH